MKAEEEWFGSTEKPHAKITCGVKAKIEEQQPAFRFEFPSESPNNGEDRQIQQHVIDLSGVEWNGDPILI